MGCRAQPVRYPVPRTVQQMTRETRMGQPSYTEFRILPIWPSRMSIIQGQKPTRHKQTAYVNGSTGPSKTNSTTSRSARSCTVRSRNCRPIWMRGWPITTNSGLIPADTAMAKRLCRPSAKRYTSRSRRRSKRTTYRTVHNPFSASQAEVSVRSSVVFYTQAQLWPSPNDV